jgi:cytochrome c oxidase subunit 1
MSPQEKDAGRRESRWGWAGRTVLSSDHRVIGLRYLWLALGSALAGMLLSLLMRMHVVWPDAQIPLVSPLLSKYGNTADGFVALTLLHGSLMIFFVLTTAPQAGFGNYFLPLQIGAKEMAFPRMNVFSWWLTTASLAGVAAAFLISPEAGLSLWTASTALFCVAGLLNAINFSVTTLDLRAKGMTLPRMPLTVWAWLVNAILSMLIFSILLGACAFLLSDRFLGSHFFSPLAFLAQQGGPAARGTLLSLWQRLFWFFAQAEVYVAILPCFGIVSHVSATFARKPVWGERAAVLALCGVGVFGFCVWGQHMFTSGLNPWSPLVFSVLASSLGIPALVLLVSWLGTLWKAKPQLNTAMLFALGFVSLFVSGGVSGLFLESRAAAGPASNDFVTGHFHLVMGVAATFALLGALFFWFPRMFGRTLNEPLGKLHFWLTLAGVYCVFMPMHWLGVMERYGVEAGDVGGANGLAASLRTMMTVATLVTVAAQGVFVFNFLSTILRRGETGERNPWLATTLEWNGPLAADAAASGEAVVYRGAYEFRGSGGGLDFAPQNAETAPWETERRVNAPNSAKLSEKPKHQTT